MYVLNKWWQWPSGPPSSEHQTCIRHAAGEGLQAVAWLVLSLIAIHRIC